MILEGGESREQTDEQGDKKLGVGMQALIDNFGSKGTHFKDRLASNKKPRLSISDDEEQQQVEVEK